ncbi:MAG TPA: hypothetical protein VGM83_00550 [Devosiaceae bacterium]|jgi:hypothetical protein
MVSSSSQIRNVTPYARIVRWRGKSGRAYPLTSEKFDDFALHSGELYVVANGDMVLWVGSDADIINDQSSRARFRLAIDCADRVFSLDAPSDEVARMTLVWDLEGAEPLNGLSAA